MEAVYIMEAGCYIRREGNSLCVVKDGRTIEQIPAEDLNRLILVGRMNLTGAVLDFLIRRRVETVFMTPTGRFRARLGIDEHKHVSLRKAQYLQLSAPDFAVRTARCIVAGKLDNMARFLRLRGRHYDDEALRAAAAGLKVTAARLANVADLDRIRGLEGAATRLYFQIFGRLIRNDGFTFNGRNRRPPLDPVNALLSFVYTLLTNEVLSAIKARGLDPYMGALHEISYGRPSLACDLVEEYRAFLGDRLVLSLINRQAIGPDDFIYRNPPPAEFSDEEEMRRKRPVEMKPHVGRTFIAAYEEMMKRTVQWGPARKNLTYRWVIMSQVQAFADYLMEPERGYVPFHWAI